MVELYALMIDDRFNSDMEKLFMDLISEEKRQKIHRLQNMKAKQQSLCADILIRYLCSIKYEVQNSSIEVSKNAYGKPYLITTDKNKNVIQFKYNVSHSNEWILAGVGKWELGVDIEAIDKTRLGIAKRFFYPEEYEKLIQISDEQRKKYFYDLWCLKESYVKYKGIGLSMGFNTFQVKLNDTQVEVIESKGLLNEGKIHIRNYEHVEAYSVAACSIEELPENISYIDLDKIYEFMK